MGAALDSLMINPGNDYTYEPAYLRFFEDHMKLLREHLSTTLVGLDAALVYKHIHDFYGYFQETGYPVEDYYILLRLNGFHHYTELTEDVKTLLIPSQDLLSRLKMLYRTTQARV